MADSTAYPANRITCRGSTDYEQTRARSGGRDPLIDQTVALELLVGGAAWAQAEAEVTARPGVEPSGALEHDQGRTRHPR
jgi:hypothetical protein